ncbi:MAG: hypothetical protein ACRENE_18165 [Polyangiaceae bacterium]
MPVETVVAILRSAGDRDQFKVHKPVEDVTHEDVAEGTARILRRDSRAW